MRDWLWVQIPRTMPDILTLVASRTGQPAREIIGSSRYRPVVRARQEFCWVAYQTGRYSLQQIGRFLGGRDHTTILHGIRRHGNSRIAATKAPTNDRPRDERGRFRREAMAA